MLFFTMLLNNILFIYFAAALLPALFLLGYVRSKERIHRTPWPVIRTLLWTGGLSAILASLIEWICHLFLGNQTFTGIGYIIYIILAVGVVEEGSKFLLLKHKTWDYPFFKTKYDGIVYSVCVGLGFAIFENIKYIFTYGIGIAPMRALTAIPGHLSFAVIMGYFYGRARFYEDMGEHGRSVQSQILGLICTAALHGFYDTAASINTTKGNLAFLFILIVVYVIIFRLVKHEANTDRII